MLPFRAPRSTWSPSAQPCQSSLTGRSERTTRTSGPFEVARSSSRTTWDPSASRTTSAEPVVVCSREPKLPRERTTGPAGFGIGFVVLLAGSAAARALTELQSPVAVRAESARTRARIESGQRLVHPAVEEQVLRCEPVDADAEQADREEAAAAARTSMCACPGRTFGSWASVSRIGPDVTPHPSGRSPTTEAQLPGDGGDRRGCRSGTPTTMIACRGTTRRTLTDRPRRGGASHLYHFRVGMADAGHRGGRSRSSRTSRRIHAGGRSSGASRCSTTAAPMCRSARSCPIASRSGAPHGPGCGERHARGRDDRRPGGNDALESSSGGPSVATVRFEEQARLTRPMLRAVNRWPVSIANHAWMMRACHRGSTPRWPATSRARGTRPALERRRS